MPQMSHKHLLVPYFPQNIITESYRNGVPRGKCSETRFSGKNWQPSISMLTHRRWKKQSVVLLCCSPVLYSVTVITSPHPDVKQIFTGSV